MKIFIKIIWDWFIPKILKLPIMYIYSKYKSKQDTYNQKELLLVKKNQNIKNIYIGKRCFIVGNGSSLLQMDLAKLRNEITFVVNNIILHKDLDRIKPKYYVMIEPISSLSSYEKSKYYYPANFFKKIDTAFKGINTSLIFNVDAMSYLESNQVFSGKDIHYVKPMGSVLEYENKLLKDDISKIITFGDGVIYTAICIAVYMGFNEIYFIGCDVDSYTNKRVNRFYSSVVEDEEDGKQNNEYYAYGNYQSLKRWRIVVNHFKKKGIKIYNAGIGGDNDTCKRVNYNDLF